MKGHIDPMQCEHGAYMGECGVCMSAAAEFMCQWCGNNPAELVLVDPTDASGPAGQLVCGECTGQTSATFREATRDDFENAGPCEIEIVARFDTRVTAEMVMAAIEELIGKHDGDLDVNTIENVDEGLPELTEDF